MRKVCQRSARKVCDASSRLGADALSTPSSTRIGDRREGQQLRDRDAGHAVDPAAARQYRTGCRANIVTTPARPNSRISASPMTKGGVMIGRIESTRRSALHRQAGARRDQREGEAEQRGRARRPAWPAPAVFQATPQAVRRRGRRGSRSRGRQLAGERRGREARRHCRGRRRTGCRAPGRTRTARSAPTTSSERADHEHVALHQPRRARPWRAA